MTYPVDQYAGAGLEDFGADEFAAPRLRIEHQDGVFVHSQTNERFPYLDCIILGLVKQRSMFPKEVKEGGSKPLCKSPDGGTGYPNMSSDAEKEFPWAQSNFNKADHPINEQLGVIQLACNSCSFAQWNDRTPPPCAEQFTLPILFNDAPEGMAGNYVPAMLTFQKSSIKETRTYIGSFKQRNEPMFAAITRIELTKSKRGNVTYATPKFTRAGVVDPSSFENYYELYKGLREYLQQVPRVEGAQPPKALPAAPVAPAIEAAPVAASAPPVSAAPPVAAAPPAPAAAPPAAPAPAPAAPAAEPVAPAQPPAPAAPAAPPPPPAAAPPAAPAAPPPPPPAPAAPAPVDTAAWNADDPWTGETVEADNSWPAAEAAAPPPPPPPAPAAPPAPAPAAPVAAPAPPAEAVTVAATSPFGGSPTPPPPPPAAAPQPQAAPAPAAPAAVADVSMPVATDDEDDLPF